MDFLQNERDSSCTVDINSALESLSKNGGQVKKRWLDIRNDGSIESNLYESIVAEESAESFHDIIKKIEKRCVEDVLRVRDIEDVTLLHLAARHGRIDAIELLLGQRQIKDINVNDKNGLTSLHHTKEIRDNLKTNETIYCLLDHGADINATTNNGETILHLLGPEVASPNILKLLLEKGAHVNATDTNGQTILHRLAGYGMKKEVFEALIRGGASINIQDNEGCTPLQRAIQYRDTFAIKTLMDDFEADVTIANKDNRTALHTAMLYTEDENSGDADMSNILDTLCSQIINEKDKNGSSALHLAVKAGKLNLMRYLIDGNADVDGVDLNHRTILHIAVLNSQVAIVEYLIVNKMTAINAKDAKGNTPLHYAVSQESIELLNMLCTEGADVNAQNKVGQSVAHYAMRTGNRDVWNALLEREANLSARNAKGYNVLEYGMVLNDPDMVEELLRGEQRDGREAQCLKLPLLEKNSDGQHKFSQFSVVSLEVALNGCIRLDDKQDVYVDYGIIVPPYDPKDPSNDYNINETVYRLSQAPHTETLLLHPAIKAYIKWKWAEIAPYYYVNLLSFLIVSLFVCFITITEREISVLEFVLLLSFAIFMCSKEALQCYTNFSDYLKSVDNYVEAGVIVVMFLMISDLKLETRNRVSAAAYILIGVSLTLMMGKHPKASTAIQLLKTVTYQFFKYFPIYILIIPSFALSFHQMFGKKHEYMNIEATDSEMNTFDARFIALQSMIMILGNFDAGDIAEEHYNYVSMTILILFLIFISIIMVNLLNGLAVSNILGKEELKISKNKSYVEYLYNTSNSLYKLQQKIKLIKRKFGVKPKSMAKLYIYTDQRLPARTEEFACIYSRRVRQHADAIEKKIVNRSMEYRLITLERKVSKIVTDASAKTDMLNKILHTAIEIKDIANKNLDTESSFEERLEEGTADLSDATESLEVSSAKISRAEILLQNAGEELKSLKGDLEQQARDLQETRKEMDEMKRTMGGTPLITKC